MLLVCDLFSRTILNGLELPVGAVTSIIGAPIFIIILLIGRGKKNA
jgi:iron complex transport system permease protein